MLLLVCLQKNPPAAIPPCWACSLVAFTKSRINHNAVQKNNCSSNGRERQSRPTVVRSRRAYRGDAATPRRLCNCMMAYMRPRPSRSWPIWWWLIKLPPPVSMGGWFQSKSCDNLISSSCRKRGEKLYMEWYTMLWNFWIFRILLFSSIVLQNTDGGKN